MRDAGSDAGMALFPLLIFGWLFLVVGIAVSAGGVLWGGGTAIVNYAKSFKENIIASGRSSYMYLQNIYSPSNHRAQALSVALCVSEKLLAPVGGAWRVHGGGFGGTIQAFVPAASVADYVAAMEDLFGKDCCYLVSVRPQGGYKIS